MYVSSFFRPVLAALLAVAALVPASAATAAQSSLQICRTIIGPREKHTEGHLPPVTIAGISYNRRVTDTTITSSERIYGLSRRCTFTGSFTQVHQVTIYHTVVKTPPSASHRRTIRVETITFKETVSNGSSTTTTWRWLKTVVEVPSANPSGTAPSNGVGGTSSS